MNTLGLRGFAQVIPQQGNIYAMSRLAEQKRQADRDYQLKREQQDLDWFTQSSKLDFANVRTELQKGLMEQFKSTNNAMQSVYQQSIAKGGLDAGSRQAITELKTNYDSMKNIAESFNKDLTGVNDVIKADKDLFNESVVASKMAGLMGNAFQKDEQGNIVGFNFESATGVSDLLSDPDIYNINEMGKRFTDSLAEIENEILSSGGTADILTTEKYSPLFETEKKGGSIILKRDPDTGNPIPKATPESLKMWTSQGKEYDQKLTRLAEQDGITRSEAFKKYIVEPFGKRSSTVDKQNKPEWMVKQGQEKATEDTAFNILEGIVVNKDKSALDQLNKFSGEDIRVEYATNTNGPEGGAPFNPNKVLIKKRETVPEAGTGDALLDALNSGKSKKKEWVTVGEFDLSNYEEAMSGLSKVLEATGGFDKNIGAKMFDRIKKSQVELGF